MKNDEINKYQEIVRKFNEDRLALKYNRDNLKKKMLTKLILKQVNKFIIIQYKCLKSLIKNQNVV